MQFMHDTNIILLTLIVSCYSIPPAPNEDRKEKVYGKKFSIGERKKFLHRSHNEENRRMTIIISQKTLECTRRTCVIIKIESRYSVGDILRVCELNFKKVKVDR